MAEYLITGTFGEVVDVETPEQAIAYAYDHGGWEWEARPKAEYDSLRALLQAAADTALGDSNDEEIQSLQEALDAALALLGMEMPEAKKED